MNGLLTYMSENRFEILQRTGEHISLTLISLGIAIVIGVSLGIWLTRRKNISSFALGVVSVIQTIPSLALLGFLLPLVGIGVLPAVIALFLYALLPIVRSTFTGIEEVSSSVKEAALGMGMSGWQILWRVELPLALPMMFAGIRTAAVINVGIATLCALIASGGLGAFIFRGVALNDPRMILAGAIPAAILALFFDGVLALVQRYIRKLILPVLVVAILAASFYIVKSVWPSGSGTGQLQAGLPAEFMERDDGYPGMIALYDLQLRGKQMDAGLMYDALREGKVDVIAGYSTDGRIAAYDLLVLDDDKHFFPPYQAAPLVNEQSLKEFPQLEGLLDQLAGKLPDSVMVQLNFQVDQDKTDPKLVAEDFMRSLGYGVDIKRQTDDPDILIGCKNFTEQYILGEIMVLLIENQSDLDVALKAGMGGTQIVFNALKAGEIDLYPEYTGTGLQVLLKAPKDTVQQIIRDPAKVYSYVSKECSERFGLQWGRTFGLNNSYALMMRREQAERLGIRSISDLKRYQEQHP